MKYRFKYIILLLALFIGGIGLKAQEFRAGVEYSRNIYPSVKAGVKYQIRDNFNTENNYNNLVQGSLGYDLNKRFSISGSYRYSFGKESHLNELEDNSFEKNRFTSEITYKTKRSANDIKLYNRLRYQHSWGNNEKDKYYLRNRVKLDLKLTDKTRPFVTLEPYYNLNDHKINKFRTSLGSQFDLRYNEIEVFIITEGKIKKAGLVTSHFVGFTYSF